MSPSLYIDYKSQLQKNRCNLWDPSRQYKKIFKKIEFFSQNHSRQRGGGWVREWRWLGCCSELWLAIQ